MDSSGAEAVDEAGVEAVAGEAVCEAGGIVLGEAGGEAAGEAGSEVAAGVAGGEVAAGGEAVAGGWDKVGIPFQNFGIWREREFSAGMASSLETSVSLGFLIIWKVLGPCTVEGWCKH